MKNKIRNGIFTIAIGYIVIIVCLMFYSYFTSEKYIYLNPDETMKETLDSFKSRISMIEEESCKEYFNDFVSFIERSNSNEKILYQEYFKNIYLNEEYVLGYALKGKEACLKITDEDINELGTYFLSASVSEDAILNHYTFQYELKLPDIMMREIMEPSTVSVNNSLKYKNEIKILELELDIVEGDNNEI